MRSAPQAAVFLDRDGTINQDVDYLSRAEDVELIPGAGQAIARLNRAGLAVVVVSNQSGLARGYFDWGDLAKVQAEINRQLAEHGAKVDAYYVCPHLPPPQGKVYELAIECDCRKPKPGLIMRAASQMALDLEESFMVGDRQRDVSSGRAANLTSILVETGQDDGAEPEPGQEPHFIARDLAQAVDWILGRLERVEA